jgi:hypothetical protein
LLGVVLGVRSTIFTAKELSLPISRVVIWSDSKCVLHWIISTKVLTVFVRNCVTEIKKAGYQYRYVPTLLNPADIPSRGAPLSDLRSSSLWWHGPEFLLSSESTWPEDNFDIPDPGGGEEDIPVAIPMLVLAPSMSSGVGSLIDISRFSSLSKLLRVTAYVQRFISRCRQDAVGAVPLPITSFDVKKVALPVSTLSAADISGAMLLWVKFLQSVKLSDINIARSTIPVPFRHLNLFTDDDGIIRCRGRLQFSSLPMHAKQPILLPKNTLFTDLVIDCCHRSQFHAGVRQTLSQLRYDYWIPQGRSQVQRVLKRCKICVKAHGGHFKVPDGPALPEDRLRMERPFSTTGVDYFGPLFIKTDQDRTSKVWICLFTCAVVRAVHLEVVVDNSVDQFLMGLQRFSSIYGAPKLLISDNAKQFTSASEILKSVFTSDEVQDFSSTNGIKWRFLPAWSPWMGGFYERLVGIVKRSLRKVLGKRCLNLVQLQTIIAETAAIVNSRPLVQCDFDVREMVLTPAHFLGKAGTAGIPAVPNDPDPVSLAASRSALMETWRKGQRILDELWNSWHKEYLAHLREYRLKNLNDPSTSGIPLEVGVVVLIKEPVPRINWRMGRIVSLQTSADGFVRSATLVLSNRRRVVRPIKLLCPIEGAPNNAAVKLNADQHLPTEIVQDNPMGQPNINQTFPVRRSRVKRNAALSAEKAIRQQLASSDEEDA